MGRYRYSPTDVITVIREGDHLFVSGQGFEKIELFPESERDFFFKAFDAQINFVVSPNESASVAIWRQAGQSQRGERTRAETSAKP